MYLKGKGYLKDYFNSMIAWMIKLIAVILIIEHLSVEHLLSDHLRGSYVSWC